MVETLIISILAVLGMLLLLIFLPKIQIGKVSLSTFYWPPLLALIILLAIGDLPLDQYLSGLTSSSGMNPLEILALFFSMTFISSILDEVGFFSYLANQMVKKAGGSQRILFLSLYGICALLTMFTSNDIVIITFTPFIIFFARDTHIDPIPFLIGEFVAANTWSSLFIFGNPTNVYLSSYFGLDFVKYLSYMWLPTLVAGLVSLGIMFLLFNKKLSKKMEMEYHEIHIKSHFILVVSLILLGLTTILMAISSYLNLSMWIFASAAALILIFTLLIYYLLKREKPVVFLDGLKRLPFTLAPFLLSMFGIVMALSIDGVSEKFASFLNTFNTTWSYGIASFFISNLMNNIPMSVFFGDLLQYLPAGIPSKSLYSTILSSNLGAILTPLGALAGVMWMRILKEHGVSFSFGKFCLYGAVISIPSFLLSCSSLFLLWY